MRIFRLLGVCLAILALATAANAASVELYNADNYIIFGTGSIGHARSQLFSPSESTPNKLAATDFFDSAAMKIRVDTATEALNINLSLFSWTGDYASTVASTPIARRTSIAMTAPFDDWVALTFPKQAATGKYLMQIWVNSYTMPAGDGGWNLWRSQLSDGGPNNAAYNDGSVGSSREYQVKLNVASVPEPASLMALGLGLVGLITRKIRK